MTEELVKVAFAGDAVEGAMIKGLLENAEIPVFLLASGTKIDGSDLAFGMLARGSRGGPQDVLVPAVRADEAVAVLGAAPASGDQLPGS